MVGGLGVRMTCLLGKAAKGPGGRRPPPAAPAAGLWVTRLVLLSALDSESASSSIRFSKACLKNVFSVLLILIYLLLMAVAVFLVYQTITDFREKLKHPVMSVSYKEVDRYDAPGRDPAPDGQRGPGLGRRLTEEPPMPSPTVLDSRGTAGPGHGLGGEDASRELLSVPSRACPVRSGGVDGAGCGHCVVGWARKASHGAGFEPGLDR